MLPLKQLKQRLTALQDDRFRPDRDWVIRNRALLREQAQNTVRQEVDLPRRFDLFQATKLFLPERVLLFGRSVGIATLIALMAVGGSIASVSASYGSQPGDALYGVKVAAEKTELIVASIVGNDEDKVKILLRHSSNRVEEYQKSKTADQASIAIHSLKKSIASANKTLESADGKAEKTVEVAKAVTQKTDALLESLAAAPSQNPDTIKEVGEAAHLIEVTGVRAVEVLVTQNLQGNAAVSLEEVKESVEKKLDKLATDVTALTKDTAVVASSTVTTTLSAALGAVATSSVAATTTVSSSAASMSSVSSTIAEAKTLIGNNDLLGALKKMEALAEVKKDAEAAALESSAPASP